MDEDTGPVQQRNIVVGKGSSVGTNNAIYTSKYNLLNFFPIVSTSTNRIMMFTELIYSLALSRPVSALPFSRYLLNPGHVSLPYSIFHFRFMVFVVIDTVIA